MPKQSIKKADVVVGNRYVAKISGKLTIVKLISDARPRGWVAQNENTGREVRIKSAAKLRLLVK
jgi:hypothetical protein